jgi:hypothetical protein
MYIYIYIILAALFKASLMWWNHGQWRSGIQQPSAHLWINPINTKNQAEIKETIEVRKKIGGEKERERRNEKHRRMALLQDLQFSSARPSHTSSVGIKCKTFYNAKSNLQYI